MKLMTRAAGKRLGILGVVLGGLVFLGHLMMIRMPLKSYEGPLPPPTAEQKALAEHLRKDLVYLGQTVGERNVFKPKKLRAAAEYIEQSFRDHGFAAVARQEFIAQGETCANIEVEVPGTSPTEIVVVGAHYDSGDGTPGANDNGSGVVALLALAQRLAGSQPARTLRLVAFVNEEPPFFQTSQMGSWVYAKRCRERGERIAAMISLETIGCYSETPGTQNYPFPLKLFYPSRGNFIAFVGNIESRQLVRDCITTFRREVPFPSEGAALPSRLTGVGWSDHWAFWQEHYPAIMVTDTAPFRYPYYHTWEDTPDKVDYERLARVTEGMERVIRALVAPTRDK